MADTGLITLKRTIAASPEKLFDALTRAEARQVWGPPDANSVVLIENQPEPAPGVREISRCGPADNPYVDVTTDWLVMEPGVRLVYAETLEAEDTLLGISLATMELEPDGTGTVLEVTVQIVSFVGADMMGEFEGGWGHALENLATFAESAGSA